MNRFGKLVAYSTLSAVLSSGALIAQDEHRDDHPTADRDNHTYVHHDEWKKGYHMKDEDWKRGEPVEYKTYHLKAPPRGYEWRLVDGNYVLGRADTGIIADIRIAPRH